MIIIPMAGLSARFFRAGYTIPKYKLPLWGRTVFQHATGSFSNLFETESFLFIVRDEHNAADFVAQEAKALGIRHLEIVTLNSPTRGQAETVQLGLERAPPTQESITIFNIDTIRPNFRPPEFTQHCDGYLEVFEGEGSHWSFIEPAEGQRVRRTTEKDRISSLCSDGLYHFRSAALFTHAFKTSIEKELFVQGEIYIAPMYNILIEEGLDIRYSIIKSSEIHFCGTPEEYESLVNQD